MGKHSPIRRMRRARFEFKQSKKRPKSYVSERFAYFLKDLVEKINKGRL